MNVYSFAAIRGVQAGRAYYVAMVPLRTVERLFRFDEEELPPELRAQRELNKARVPAIARYLATNAGEYVLSSLAATVDGGMRFEPVDGHRSVGTLIVDMTATIVINDGQHRRAGIIEALRERPHLGDETIAVTLFPDAGLARSQQMFVDLALSRYRTQGAIIANRSGLSQPLSRLAMWPSPGRDRSVRCDAR